MQRYKIVLLFFFLWILFSKVVHEACKYFFHKPHQAYKAFFFISKILSWEKGALYTVCTTVYVKLRSLAKSADAILVSISNNPLSAPVEPKNGIIAEFTRTNWSNQRIRDLF